MALEGWSEEACWHKQWDAWTKGHTDAVGALASKMEALLNSLSPKLLSLSSERDAEPVAWEARDCRQRAFRLHLQHA